MLLMSQSVSRITTSLKADSRRASNFIISIAMDVVKPYYLKQHV